MKTIALSLAVFFAALTAGAAFAENPKVGGAPMLESMNIVQNALNSADLATLVAAMKATGLVDTLMGPGPFTVFAPTSDAIAKLPKGTVETLLKPENHDKLVKILTCHVVAADALAETVKGMIQADGGKHMIKTVGGCKLTATTAGGKILITDEAGGTATIADVKQSNSVIHVIDAVLLPKMQCPLPHRHRTGPAVPSTCPYGSVTPGAIPGHLALHGPGDAVG